MHFKWNQICLERLQTSRLGVLPSTMLSHSSGPTLLLAGPVTRGSEMLTLTAALGGKINVRVALRDERPALEGGKKGTEQKSKFFLTGSSPETSAALHSLWKGPHPSPRERRPPLPPTLSASSWPSPPFHFAKRDLPL